MAYSTFLTANDLRTGHIVFWTDGGVWSVDPKRAKIATNEDEVAELDAVMARAQTDIEVVGAYLVHSGGSASPNLMPIAPKKMRERRRLLGPGASTSSHRHSSIAA